MFPNDYDAYGSDQTNGVHGLLEEVITDYKVVLGLCTQGGE
jgi:hypothetical protein